MSDTDRHGTQSPCWVPDADKTGFRLAHLPYGVVDFPTGRAPAVRIGDHALNLRACTAAGLVPDDDGWSQAADLGGLLALPPDAWPRIRGSVTQVLAGAQPPEALPEGALHALTALPAPVLPFAVGDYVDFYSSLHHATNVGRLFRPDADPLLPNWRHIPIGYHGRAGTVVVSGTDIVRPAGQHAPNGSGQDAALPSFGPTRRLDIELEVGFVTGGPATTLGHPLSTAEAAQRIFGVALVNDWSARDIQAWEYKPLGPFLGKSFATSIGPWVTPMAALDAARRATPPRDPQPLPHLRVDGDWALDLSLEVAIQPAGDDHPHTISRTSFTDMWWTMPQQLVHAASNGATVRPGDLFASGTVSGPDRGTEGSLLELTWGGVEPLVVGDTTRTFLHDGDRVVLRGSSDATDGGRLTLAEVDGRIVRRSPGD